MGRQSQMAGDLAAAVVAAHEFGHSVVHAMASQANAAAPSGKNNELITDCFAEVWTAHVFYEGLLNDNDQNEAIDALEAIGDTNPQAETHGSAQERVDVFNIGYAGIQGQYAAGTPAACVATYWT